MYRNLLALLALLPLSLAAQQDTAPPPPAPIDIETLPSNNGTFTQVSEQPEFPGGQAALMKYMQMNLRYPDEMREAEVQGRVFIGFTVAVDGSVKDAVVKRGVAGGKPLEEEALRVVRAMPAWVPGKVNNVPVPTEYVLPVTFQLD